MMSTFWSLGGNKSKVKMYVKMNGFHSINVLICTKDTIKYQII